MKLRKHRQNVMEPHISGDRPSTSASLTMKTMAAITTTHSNTLMSFYNPSEENRGRNTFFQSPE